MRKKSIERMEGIIEYINERYFENNEIPTMQEIADKMGMSKGNVSDYVREMEQNGMLSADGKRRTQKIEKVQRSVCLPVIGNIACGTPMFAEQNVESYFTFSISFTGKGEFYVLRAEGDSMINAGISNGDYVIVRKQNTAEDGQIVVALIEDSATLKRFYREKYGIRLHPENDRMSDMLFDTVQIQGIAVKVVKNLEKV